jgi:hypothetical protein
MEGARGRSSVVERQLPKLNVVGSIPIARSTQPSEQSEGFDFWLLELQQNGTLTGC